MTFLFSFFQLFFAYFIGSLPTGSFIAYLKGIKNIRAHGSGNIGATNVARVLGIHYFFLVFFIDCFKAYAALWGIYYWGASCSWLLVCALAVLLGNSRSIFLRLKGGKGIATSFGLVLFLFPSILLIVVPVWLLVLALIRNVGMASVASMVVLPFAGIVLGADIHAIWFLVIVALWCIFLHRVNIKLFVTKT